MINRRQFIAYCASSTALLSARPLHALTLKNDTGSPASQTTQSPDSAIHTNNQAHTMTQSAPELAPNPATIEPFTLNDAQWRERLTPEQYRVLRKHGTERAGTSALNEEKRAGDYACAGCGLVLFHSHQKYDSGTGWPSFFDTIEGRIGTSTDFKLIYPRTEYHCARCKGHHGHVFKDGPEPTGLRYCNNGVALLFIPKNQP